MRELGSLIAAVILALAYTLGSKVNAVHIRHRRRWISIAAGASVAYVFIHVFPELSESQTVLLEVVKERGLLFAETRVYLAALIGFILFYGLDSMVFHTRTPEHSKNQLHHNQSIIYWIHIIGFAVYNAIVGYLLVDWARGIQALVLYAATLSFHLLVVDHSLSKEYGTPYDRSGRWMLAGAILVGWLIGFFAPLDPANLAILVGFISGAVVLNSVKDEFPESGQGKFIPFTLAAVVYALLLLLSER
jgi:uncharacterized protein YqgC (DUF456 family)